jgi:hypothetical protein
MKIAYEGNGHKVSAEDMSLSEYLVFADNLEKFKVFQGTHVEEMEAYNSYVNNQIRVIEEHPHAASLILPAARTPLALPPAQVHPYQQPVSYPQSAPDLVSSAGHQVQSGQGLSFPKYDQPPIYPTNSPSPQTAHQPIPHYSQQDTYIQSDTQVQSPTQVQSQPQTHESDLVLYGATVLQPGHHQGLTSIVPTSAITVRDGKPQNWVRTLFSRIAGKVDGILETNPYVYGGLLGLSVILIVLSVLSSSKSPVHMNSVKPTAPTPAAPKVVAPKNVAPVAPAPVAPAPVAPAPVAPAAPKSDIPPDPPPPPGL